MMKTTTLDESQRVTFRHLSRLTDDRGILEHAKGRHPRFSFGYCTDDNARLAVTALHDGGRSFGSEILGRIALGFVQDALDDSGMVRNRLSFQRVWTDAPSTDDCWGALSGRSARPRDSVSTTTFAVRHSVRSTTRVCTADHLCVP
jgi:hypothetical protein